MGNIFDLYYELKENPWDKEPWEEDGVMTQPND